MKTLSITLAINATNSIDAEKIAERELMYMAKTIAKRCGAAMGSGNGNTTRVFDCIYKIDAEVQIDCNGNINDVTKEIQSTWTSKPDIVSSMIFVNDNDETEGDFNSDLCGECGCATNDGITVYGKEEEKYILCKDCFNKLYDNGDVILCEGCDEYVYARDLYKNPVTGYNNICPHCGNTN